MLCEAPETQVLHLPYYRQFQTNWCAFTSTAMVLRFYGVSAKPWSVADGMNKVVDEGLAPYELDELADYMDAQGIPTSIEVFSPDFVTYMDEIEMHLLSGNPVMVMSGSENHAMVITGSDDQNVYIHDPSGATVNSVYGEPAGLVFSHVPVSWTLFQSLMSSWLGVFEFVAFMFPSGVNVPLESSISFTPPMYDASLFGAETWDLNFQQDIEITNKGPGLITTKAALAWNGLSSNGLAWVEDGDTVEDATGYIADANDVLDIRSRFDNTGPGTISAISRVSIVNLGVFQPPLIVESDFESASCNGEEALFMPVIALSDVPLDGDGTTYDELQISVELIVDAQVMDSFEFRLTVYDGDLVCEPQCDGKSCGDDGCGDSCGPCANPCTGDPDDPLLCENGTCVDICCPQCDGKSCGPDGCGDVCGECGPTQVCNQDGACVYVCGPAGPGSCKDKCEGISGDCYCDANCVVNGDCCADYEVCCCEPDCTGKECGDDKCGGTCGDCDDLEPCTNDTCDNGTCAHVWNGTITCTDSTDCEDGDLCTIDTCSSDSCNSWCENTPVTCPDDKPICQDGICVCIPNCTDRECGDDGCGDSCGDCPDDMTCTDLGQCIECTPDCSGKECGDDGCGGTCGDCDDQEPCTDDTCDEPSGTCTNVWNGILTCSADADCEDGDLCTIDTCNSDSCNSWCENTPVTCPNDKPICQDGICVCVPNCLGRECGPDGCGGQCPPGCDVGVPCNDVTGLCEPPMECGPAGPDSCMDKCGSFTNNCFCDENCTVSGDCCADYDVCCCQPDCTGMECGDGGCPDQPDACGTCSGSAECESGLCICPPDNEICMDVCCDSEQVCFEDACCTPDCQDKECGDDGCGQQCPPGCLEDTPCVDGQCVMAGDLAPFGAPDGCIDVSDAVVVLQMAVGEIVPTAEQILVADVAPFGFPDGLVDVGDAVVILQAAVGNIDIGSPTCF